MKRPYPSQAPPYPESNLTIGVRTKMDRWGNVHLFDLAAGDTFQQLLQRRQTVSHICLAVYRASEAHWVR